MAENQETTDKKIEEPLHIKQSKYALDYLNEWVNKLVLLKNNVNYLEGEEARVSLTHVDSEWKKIHQQLTERRDNLKDVRNAVKHAKEVLEKILALEREGKWLE